MLYLKKLPSGKYVFARSAKEKKWTVDFIFVDDSKKKEKKKSEDEKQHVVTGPSYSHDPWNWHYPSWQYPYSQYPNWQYPAAYPPQNTWDPLDLGSSSMPAVGPLAPAPPPPPYNPPDTGAARPDHAHGNPRDDPLALASMVAQPTVTQQQPETSMPTDRHVPAPAPPSSPPANPPPGTSMVPNGPVPDTAPKAQGAEPKHTCMFCSRARSPAYHARNPMRPGESPIRGVCHKCNDYNTSSDEAADNANKRRRKRHSKKDKSGRGADRRDRPVVYVDIPTDSDTTDQSDHGSRRPDRRRRGSVHRNRGNRR